MASSSGREQAFHQFLCSAFDADGLRRWVYFEVGNDAYAALPAPPADVEHVAFGAFQQIKQRDRFDEALFGSLLDMRKERADEIRDLAGRWGIDLETEAQPAPATDGSKRAGTGAARGESSPPGPERSPGPGREPTASRRGGRRLSHTAMLLDRTSQWAQLKLLCETKDESVAFVVHGPAGLDVELFCQRTQRYLHDECKRPHGVHRLMFVNLGVQATSPDDWLDRLRLALGGGSDLAGRVHGAASIEALMLIIGEAPLYGLDAVETRALCEFLAVSLPGVIADAAAANPIRVLIPIQHAGPHRGMTDPLVQAVNAAIGRAKGFQTEHLVELAFPHWSEVENYLFQQLGTIEQEFLESCRATYEAVAVSERSFTQLARALNDLLESKFAPNPPNAARP